MLYTKIQPENFLSTGEEDFLSVLTIYGHAAILINDAKPFEQSVNMLSVEGPM